MKLFQQNKLVQPTTSACSYFIKEIRDEQNRLIRYVYMDHTPILKNSPYYDEFEEFRKTIGMRKVRC